MTNAITPEIFDRAQIRSSARRWPRNPFVHAALAYPRRWLFRFHLAWLLLCIAGSIWIFTAMVQSMPHSDHPWTAFRELMLRSMQNTARSEQNSSYRVIGVLIMLGGVLLPSLLAITGHARESLTDWRADSLPGYRPAHLLAALCAIVFVLFVGVLMIWLVAPLSPVALLFLATSLAVLCLWAHSLSVVSNITLAAFLVALLSFNAIRSFMDLMLVDLSPVASILCLLIAVGFFAHAAGALLKINTPASQPLALNSLLRTIPARNASRLRRWRTPTSPGVAPCIIAANLFIMSMFVIYFADDPNNHHGLAGGAALLALLANIIPPLAVTSQWSTRITAMGRELALPITRQHFLRTMALSFLADYASWWFLITLSGLLGIFIAACYESQSFHIDPMLFHLAWLLLIASILVHFFSYTLILLVARLQSVGALNVASIFAALLTAAIEIAITIAVTTNRPMMQYIIPLPLILASILLLLAARRTWKDADIR